MKYIKHKSEMLRLTGVALFSLLVCYLITPFVFPSIDKYQTGLKEKKNKEAAFLWYCDLDDDGYSEKIKCSRGDVMATNIFVESKGKLLDQWNLHEEMVVFHPAYGDYDQNGLSEVYVFTHSNDSLFGNWFEPYNDKSIIHTRFITAFRRRKGKADFGVMPCGFTDGDNDGSKELALLINAGFSRQPRNIFLWDIKNDTVYASPQSGAAIKRPIACDLDNDGRQDILVSNFATGNFPDTSTIPYSDKYCWLMAFNNRAEFLFEPLQLGEYPSNVMTMPYNTGNRTCIAALYCYAGTDNRQCSIGLYSPKGKLIRKRNLGPYSAQLHNATLLSEGSEYEHLYLAYGNGEIQELDSTLAVIGKHTVPGALNICEYRQGMIDIDGNGNNEWLFHGKNENLIITGSDFSHPLSIPFPPDGEIWYTTVLNGEAPPQLFIAGKENAFVFSYAANPFYGFKYPAWAGMYAIVFLLLFAVRKILKKARPGLREEDNVTTCLTEREREIFILLAQGKTNRQIADKLFISVDTVKTHRKNIKKKTGLKSTEALIAHAHQHNLT